MSKKLLHSEYLKLSGNRIHILSEVRDDFEVWLNTDSGDYDGLCIGCGVTREGAITDAIDILQQGVTALKKSRHCFHHRRDGRLIDASLYPTLSANSIE